jgi:predicted ArsR family transcriptional regulator
LRHLTSFAQLIWVNYQQRLDDSVDEVCDEDIMDVPDHSTDPLSQPTRAQIFAELGQMRSSATTEDLAKRLGKHVNGVRTHLERLTDAGLVTRERERRGRGRPRDVWRVAPHARPLGTPPSAYAELAGWLVRSLGGSGATTESVETVGREIGRDLAPEELGESLDAAMFDALAALGFQPDRVSADEQNFSFCLNNCPYRDAVRQNRALVCALHRGMTAGMVESLDPAAELHAFVAKDPDVAGCEIEVRSA